MTARELIIDSFAGGGGASTGIELALGRSPDVAINHNPVALAMHRANHPDTLHLSNDIWAVDPMSVRPGELIGLLWASPDCFPAGTLILTERGYRPIETIEVGDMVLTHRGRYRPVYATMQTVKPLVSVFGQGVPEIFVSAEHPFYTRAVQNVWDQSRRRYKRTLGDPEWTKAKELRTAGAPTNTGADLDAPAPTITANSYVKRPGGAAPIGIVAATLTSFYGDGDGGKDRSRSAEEPLATDTSGGNRHGLIAASLANLHGTNEAGAPADEPARTISTGGHAGVVAAFLDAYYGSEQNTPADEPMHTIPTKPRFSLVTVEIDGQTYAIVDIGMRMLTPRERFRAQGFPDSYVIETGIDADGRPVALTAEAQGRACGNSVCPPIAAALVAANCPDLAISADPNAAVVA
ncbi:MAG: Hint domain-containing protein [Amaricoccus sp.]